MLVFKKIKLYVVYISYLLALFASVCFSVLIFQSEKRKRQITNLKRKNFFLKHEKAMIKAEILFSQKQKKRKKEIEKAEKILNEINKKRIKGKKNENKKDKDFVEVYK